MGAEVLSEGDNRQCRQHTKWTKRRGSRSKFRCSLPVNFIKTNRIWEARLPWSAWAALKFGNWPIENVSCTMSARQRRKEAHTLSLTHFKMFSLLLSLLHCKQPKKEECSAVWCRQQLRDVHHRNQLVPKPQNFCLQWWRAAVKTEGCGSLTTSGKTPPHGICRQQQDSANIRRELWRHENENDVV